MLIARWGNSLAVRIPADVVRELGLKEGDDVSLSANGERALVIARETARDKAMEVIRSFRGSLPPGYKFDRDEANARGNETD